MAIKQEVEVYQGCGTRDDIAVGVLLAVYSREQNE